MTHILAAISILVLPLMCPRTQFSGQQDEGASSPLQGPTDGYTKAEELQLTFKITRKDRPVYLFPRGFRLAEAGTISVQIDGKPAQETEEAPMAGQYRTLLDQSILFSRQDTGKLSIISASVRRRRVASLVYTPSSIDYVPDLFHKPLNDALGKEGFAGVDIADENAVVRKLGHSIMNAFAENRLSVPAIENIGRTMNCRLFLAADVDPTETGEGTQYNRVYLAGDVVLIDLDGPRVRQSTLTDRFEFVKLGTHRSARQLLADAIVAELLKGFW